MVTEKLTAPRVKNLLDDHLLVHEKNYDKTLNRHEVILFGEKGDNGLCSKSKDHETRIENLEKVGTKIDGLKWSIILWVVLQALTALPKIIEWANAQ